MPGLPDLVPLPGSERSQLRGAAPAPAPLDDGQIISVTVLLRRRAEMPRAPVEGPQTISTSNGAYKAGSGWDACTGLGSPNGGALLTLLSGTTPTTGS